MSVFNNSEVQECARWFSVAQKPDDVLAAWCKLKTKHPELSGIVHLDNYDRSTMPSSIKKYTQYPNDYLVSYYVSDSLYFVDDAMIREILDNNEKRFAVDYSIMFDTNMASYINRLVQGKAIGDNRGELQGKVLKVIDDLLRDNLNFDFIFYMLENIKNVANKADFDTNSKLKFWMSLNKDLRENITSLHLFSSIDNKLYKKTLNPKPMLSHRQSVRKAVDASFDFYRGEIGSEQAEQWVLFQRMMLLCLIGMIRIQLASNRSAKNKMSDFFNFMHEVTGAYMDREAQFALNYFLSPSSTSILNKIHKRCKTKGLLKRLDNIAWDMLAPRYMEKLLTHSATNNCEYFVPYFLSFDKGLREMLNQYKIKGAIYHRETGDVISFPGIDSGNLYEKNGLKTVIERFFSSELKSERESRIKLNRVSVHKAIIEEYDKLKQVIS